MNNLEKLREWLKTYPGYNILENFSVDYTDQIPNNGGIFPSGLSEVSRRRDITGRTTVNNQLNFGLYYIFEKSPGDDEGAKVNADWISDFQMWVQAQSAQGKAPTFGDEPWNERISAQNGVLYQAEAEGTATYMVQLSVTYTIKY